MLAKPDRFGLPRQRLRGDDGRLDLRLLPFAVAGVLTEQRLDDDQSEDGIAEELERLVVGDATRDVLGRPRLVRQRMLEETTVPEPILDAGLQLVELVAQPHHARA